MKLSHTLIGSFLVALLGSIASAVEPEAFEEALAGAYRITDGGTSGTGFLFEAPAADGAKNTLYFGTAAHVFTGMKKDSCKIMLRGKNAEGNYERRESEFPIRKGGEKLWKQHEKFDVAALPITLPENIEAKPFAWDRLVTEQMLAEKFIRLGQDVWIPCYPAQVEANPDGFPIFRRGSVAGYPLAPLKEAPKMLIDFTTFGGDSGAPILVREANTGKIFVAGIVLGMHRLTDRSTTTFEERTIHTPLGLSIIAPTQYLIDMVADKVLSPPK